MERIAHCFHVIFLDLVCVDLDYNCRNNKNRTVLCANVFVVGSTEGKMGTFGIKWLGQKL